MFNKKEYVKQYRDTHKEEMKMYREKNKERIKKNCKKYYKAHEEHLKIKQKEYNEIHKEKIQQYKKQHRNNNRERYNELGRKYVKKYKKNHPYMAFAHNFSNHHRKELLKECCEICGSKDILELHHPDHHLYEIVITLCRNCHHKISQSQRQKEKGLVI